MKKVGKTTRPFRNVKSNTFRLYSGSDKYIQGSDLIDRVPEEIWTEVHNLVPEAGIKTIPRKRNAKRQNGFLRRPYK